MLLQKELLRFPCLAALLVSVVAKLPPGAPWTEFASKPAFSRSLGPPPISGIGTVPVPYMPKSPLFPKFVDPKMMISKKTEMLSNLFGGLNPAAYGASPYLLPPYLFGGSYPSYTLPAATKRNVDNDNQNAEKLSEEADDDTVDPTKDVKRGALGPYGSKFGAAGGKFGGGSMSGFVNPKFASFGGPVYPGSKFGSAPFGSGFAGADEWYRKKRSLDGESSPFEFLAENGKPSGQDLGPPPAYPGLNTIPEEPENETIETGAKAGGVGGPREFLPGMFGPFGPVVDPSMFIAKKYAFLDTLFKNIATSTPEPTEEPIAKSTIVPPSFWFPSSVFAKPSL